MLHCSHLVAGAGSRRGRAWRWLAYAAVALLWAMLLGTVVAGVSPHVASPASRQSLPARVDDGRVEVPSS